MAEANAGERLSGLTHLFSISFLFSIKTCKSDTWTRPIDETESFRGSQRPIQHRARTVWAWFYFGV